MSGARFDHGELQIPLKKRLKGFHGQIDRYKAEQTKAEEESQKARLARVRHARGVVNALHDGRVKALARGKGLTVKQARTHLLSLASSRPELIEKTLQRPDRCELCADWRVSLAPRGNGECWSADRLDGRTDQGPAGYCWPDETCEAFNGAREAGQ